MTENETLPTPLPRWQAAVIALITLAVLGTVFAVEGTAVLQFLSIPARTLLDLVKGAGGWFAWLGIQILGWF